VITFFAVLLLFIAFTFGLCWLLLVPQMIINGPGPRDTVNEMVTVGLVLTGGFIVFGAGTAALWPLAAAPTRFTPAYGTISALTAGHPFAVRYQRVGWGRTMSDTGSVRFDADGLTIMGYVTPNPLLPLLVLILFTAVPLVMFGVGLGFIPALILAHYLGRRQHVMPIRYQDLYDLTVQGCRVTFSGPETPRQISFFVASVDGERLYRELLPRFPAALGGWQE
jgi:hypothetical protein